MIPEGHLQFCSTRFDGNCQLVVVAAFFFLRGAVFGMFWVSGAPTPGRLIEPVVFNPATGLPAPPDPSPARSMPPTPGLIAVTAEFCIPGVARTFANCCWRSWLSAVP